jgi:hypothetical protein
MPAFCHVQMTRDRKRFISITPVGKTKTLDPPLQGAPWLVRHYRRAGRPHAV